MKGRHSAIGPVRSANGGTGLFSRFVEERLVNRDFPPYRKRNTCGGILAKSIGIGQRRAAEAGSAGQNIGLEVAPSIEGRYDKGRVELDEKAHADKSMVIALFPTEAPAEGEIMSTEEAFRILDKYKGSIRSGLCAKAEKLAYLDERYGSANYKTRFLHERPPICFLPRIFLVFWRRVFLSYFLRRNALPGFAFW